MHTVFNHREGPRQASLLRTGAVMAHTLATSARLVVRQRLVGHDELALRRAVDRWCHQSFRFARARLRVEGAEHAQPGQSYVLLSNHQSLMDIPAVVATFPGEVRFVAKQELRRIPFFGQAMEDAGIVFVDRKHRDRAIEQLKHTADVIRHGQSIWIAVEGTRNATGTLGPFKKGPFHTALQLGVPVLPTWIVGTGDILPPHQLAAVTCQDVVVRYGPPIHGITALQPLMQATRHALETLASA